MQAEAGDFVNDDVVVVKLIVRVRFGMLWSQTFPPRPPRPLPGVNERIGAQRKQSMVAADAT